MRNCKHCAQEFQPGKGNTPYCGMECRLRGQVKIEPSGCWLWRGAIAGDGYGAMKIRQRQIGAHRAAYEHWRGPADGHQVLHHCDTPLCINPAHLFLGSHGDNMADRSAKGRDRGERNGRARLTEETVRAIRGDGRPAYILAAELGVGTTTVQHVRRGETWKHIG